jgi:DNA helicase-2/ATP-dependent DNA helicase PcrA
MFCKKTNYNENKLEVNNLYGHYINNRVVVFDTETTGLDVTQNDIIKIAAIAIVKGEITEHINFYFETDQSLSPTQKIHNISNEELAKKAIDKKIGLMMFTDFIGSDPIVAHNIFYDYQILNSNLEKIGLEKIYVNKMFCTLKISRITFPEINSYKLSNLIKQLSLEGINSHDALDDTKATVNLLAKIVEKNKIF